MPDYHKARRAADSIFEILDTVPRMFSSSLSSSSDCAYCSSSLFPGTLAPEFDPTSPIGSTEPFHNVPLKFSELCFAYPSRPNAQVLKSLSCEVPSGKRVALVGATGCGKSTLLALLQRFYNPTSGQMAIEERPISSLRLSWLRDQISLVAQVRLLLSYSSSSSSCSFFLSFFPFPSFISFVPFVVCRSPSCSMRL